MSQSVKSKAEVKPSAQQQRIFFDFTVDRRFARTLPPPPKEDDIRNYLNSSPDCPLHKVVIGPENEGNMRTLKRFAFTALKKRNRSCRGCNFLMCATSGQGKSYIARQFAKTIGVPFVEVQCAALTDTWMLFELIKDAFARHEFNGDAFYQPIEEYRKFDPIVEDNTDPAAKFVIPPCIVFFDECHLIPKKLMKGGLLNAMESNDGYLQVKPPGVRADAILINCKAICWTGATTERGMMFDALENRFATTIEWAPASTEDIAKITFGRMEEQVIKKLVPFPMPIESCEKVAKYRHIPREAISFAEKVIQHKDMFPADGWDEAVDYIARDIGLDAWGFTKKQVDILTALGQRPIAEGRLSGVAHCRIEQVERYELPMLMSYVNGGPFIVAVSGKGMCITMAGLKELDKRRIAHRGTDITAEYFESRRAS